MLRIELIRYPSMSNENKTQYKVLICDSRIYVLVEQSFICTLGKLVEILFDRMSLISGAFELSKKQAHELLPRKRCASGRKTDIVAEASAREIDRYFGNIVGTSNGSRASRYSELTTKSPGNQPY